MMVMRFLDICQTMDMPCIKVRKNSRVKWKRGNIIRNLSVLAQRNDIQKWKDSVSYGQRWIVETVFSCLKRMFGEYVYSVKSAVKDMIYFHVKYLCLFRYRNNFRSSLLQ